MTSEKRKRSTSFTTSEIELLVDLIVDKYGKIIENKMTDSITRKQKEAAWANLSLDFNAQSSTNRNDETLKMKYEELKKNLKKKKYEANKLEIYKTGGGEATESKYENHEKKLLLILTISVEGLPCEVDSDSININAETDVSAGTVIREIGIVETGGFNLADANIRMQYEDMIIVEPGPSKVYDDMTTETEIEQEQQIKQEENQEIIEFNTPSVSENGKKRKLSGCTPQTLKRPITKKLTSQKPKEQINNKFYMLADERSELLKQQLIIAEKESYLKDLEIKIKERELENMQKEHELKMKILEKEYNKL